MKKNLKLETYVGDNFSTGAKKAKQLSIQKLQTVEFDFNGIKCLVSKDTNLDWLWRDYMNAHRMKWKTIGPNCVVEYSAEIQSQINEVNKVAEKKQAKKRLEWKKKDEKERADFEEKVKGMELEFSETGLEDWNKIMEVNQDGYGVGILNYAESWAKLMQVEIANGKSLIDCAEPTSFELGFLGITGYMYGAAVSTLAKCWKHGEALRKWHNKDYDQPESKGVINPAIISIGLSQD